MKRDTNVDDLFAYHDSEDDCMKKLKDRNIDKILIDVLKFFYKNIMFGQPSRKC